MFYDRIRNSILDYKMLTDRLWADAMNLIRNRLKIKNFSCYSLRKTFGRQVYNMNSESSELVLVKLMEMFNYIKIYQYYCDFCSAIPNTENKEDVGYWIYN